MTARRRNVMRVAAVVAVAVAVAVAVVVYGPRAGRRMKRPAPPREAAPLVEPGDPPPGPLPELDAPSVLVEKRARRLTVFDGERPVKRYRVALGSGRGDKQREGDGCTPEGTFYICHHNPQSSYHLSMGLSYPNAEDARRGLRDELISRSQHDAIVSAIRRRTRPPWNTELGGEIMIHGHGAGRDWTAGCVALSNADVEELYHALPDSTEVRIVP
ncbi:MAG: L,D-transpeptidase [Phycisphaerae bacterium]|nr:L,D-transpeptidase [Phycisphaerae bacterium]